MKCFCPWRLPTSLAFSALLSWSHIPFYLLPLMNILKLLVTSQQRLHMVTTKTIALRHSVGFNAVLCQVLFHQ
jgi:hypothetical protein